MDKKMDKSNPQKIREWLQNQKNRAALEAAREQAKQEGEAFLKACEPDQRKWRDTVVTI